MKWPFTKRRHLLTLANAWTDAKRVGRGTLKVRVNGSWLVNAGFEELDVISRYSGTNPLVLLDHTCMCGRHIIVEVTPGE